MRSLNRGPYFGGQVFGETPKHSDRDGSRSPFSLNCYGWSIINLIPGMSWTEPITRPSLLKRLQAGPFEEDACLSSTASTARS